MMQEIVLQEKCSWPRRRSRYSKCIVTEECLMAWRRLKLYRDTKGWKANMAELYCNTPRCIVTEACSWAGDLGHDTISNCIVT